MRAIEPVKLLVLATTLPARAYTVADGYARAAHLHRQAAAAGPNATTTHACAAPRPPAADVPAAPSSSSSVPSALASSLLAEEVAGLEDALALLLPRFEALRSLPIEEGGILPEDPVFGTRDAAGVPAHDVEMHLIRYLRAARAGLSRRYRGDAARIADAALARIGRTLAYRREYDVLAMHAPGMARKLMVGCALLYRRRRR